jgi:large subunit ribosomal protein L30e
MARKKRAEDEEDSEEETTEQPDENPAGEETAAEQAEEAQSESSSEGAQEVAEEIGEGNRGRNKRRVVRIRKTKKERENPVATAIRLAVDSGKVTFGYKDASKEVLSSAKAKVLVVAKRAPQHMHESISHYAKIAGIATIEFEGTPLELGSACGKPFNVSVLSVFDAGTSNILELAKKKNQ